MNRFTAPCAVGFGIAMLAASSVSAANIVNISFPESVLLSGSTTATGPRSVDAPFDYSGIGNIINPSFAAPGSGANAPDFALHQTVGVVNLTDVVVTYEFDTAVVIDAFDVVQHHNGVRTLELFVGDSLGAMVSAGTATVPENTIEYALNVFDFDTALAGRFIQLRVIETDLPGQGGWAMYRAIPTLVPSTGTAGLAMLGLLAGTRRRRSNA